MGLFDVFKDKDEDSDDGGITEEYQSEDTSSGIESEPEPAEEATKSSYEAPPASSMRHLLLNLLKKQPHIHKLELLYKVRLE